MIYQYTEICDDIKSSVATDDIKNENIAYVDKEKPIK